MLLVWAEQVLCNSGALMVLVVVVTPHFL